jgi:hypothetical protein
MKPAIVLVHGAFAESASWNKVIDSLAGAGHPVIAAPNPLRSPADPPGRGPARSRLTRLPPDIHPRHAWRDR